MRYWLTPPDIYDALNAEFSFDFDPCPYPRQEGYDGLLVPWGSSNYVNPPFKRADGSPTAFAHKAIAERAKGNRSVVLLPVPSYAMHMIAAGAEVRSMGRVRWLEAETKEPYKSPSPICAFIL